MIKGQINRDEYNKYMKLYKNVDLIDKEIMIVKSLNLDKDKDLNPLYLTVRSHRFLISKKFFGIGINPIQNIYKKEDDWYLTMFFSDNEDQFVYYRIDGLDDLVTLLKQIYKNENNR